MSPATLRYLTATLRNAQAPVAPEPRTPSPATPEAILAAFAVAARLPRYAGLERRRNPR